MANTFKIGYLPLSKVNWTNDTLEAARANAIAFLKTLPGVEVMAPDHMLTLEDEAVARSGRRPPAEQLVLRGEHERPPHVPPAHPLLPRACRARHA